MDFDIVEDDGMSVVLAPLRVSVLHSDFQVQLGDRLDAIARDWGEIDQIRGHDPKLAEAIEAHGLQIRSATNSNEIRKAADRMIRLKSKLFGQTNAGSATTLIEVEAKSEVEAEEIVGREGRLLVRLHSTGNATEPLCGECASTIGHWRRPSGLPRLRLRPCRGLRPVRRELHGGPSQGAD